jgi:hypothetical protein
MELVIQSNLSDRELVFSRLPGDYFSIKLRGGRLSAIATVYADGSSGYLSRMFQEMGRLEKPWSDARTWESLEEEFSMAITCNNRGHVRFDIKMRVEQGELDPERAFVTASLTVDLGTMPSLARDARSFFEQE